MVFQFFLYRLVVGSYSMVCKERDNSDLPWHKGTFTYPHSSANFSLFFFAVIADSLTVVAPAQTLSKVEGDTLQLTCEVSRTTLQHTHLSVGWYLRSPEDAASPPQELVTLSRDFVLRSGGPYRQRMAAGDLRLDKTSATSYRLTIHKLQPVDQGLLYCQATEWIQDTDGSWFAMTRKQSEKTQLRIQPTGESRKENL